MDADAWGKLKNELVAIIIPIRRRVMHHRPVHLYHLAKVIGHTCSLREYLGHSRQAIDEKQRNELQDINKEITQALQSSVPRLYSDLFGSTEWVQSLAKQQEAFRKSISPFAEIQKEWKKQMNPWLEMEEQMRKQT